MGSVHANVITDLFFPKLEKLNNCIDNLKKQNIDNGDKLCIDKYAKKINLIFPTSSDAWITTDFAFQIDNTSNKYTIKAIHLKGYFGCKDESKCKKQYFDETRYVSISPGGEDYVVFMDLAGINLPDGLIVSDMIYKITTEEYLGFRIDY